MLISFQVETPLLDKWKLFLIGVKSVEDFDLELCPLCDTLVKSATIKNRDVKKVDFVSDRDGTATGSGQALVFRFVTKATRHKLGSDELSSKPLWVHNIYDTNWKIYKLWMYKINREYV